MNAIGAVIGVVMLTASILFGAPSDRTDEEGIRAAVGGYFAGLETRDAGALRRCFAPCAHLKFVRKAVDGSEEAVAVPIDRAIDSWMSAPPAPTRGSVLSVDQPGADLAVVKAEVLWQGRLYLDVLTLYRVGGEWRIVDKVFVNKGPAQ
jgi:hypothetical protein